MTSLLVGPSCFKDISFLYEDYYKVALDGGYHYFFDNRIRCDLFIGDNDTNDILDLSLADKKIILNRDKDISDSFYAIDYLLDKGFDDFVFLGCLNGRADMNYLSVSLLSYIDKRGGKAVLYNDDEMMYLIKDKKEFDDERGRISLFSLCDESEIEIKNLLYEYEGKLSFDSSLCLSNRIVKPGYIKVKKGRLIAFQQRWHKKDINL